MKRHIHTIPIIILACCAAAAMKGWAAAPSPISGQPRGAQVETERYRAVIHDGVVVGFFNKLTQEEYLNPRANLDNILPYLPSGLGTIDGTNAFLAARGLLSQPWWEFVYKNPRADETTAKFWSWFEPLYKGSDKEGELMFHMPNQHRPTAASAFTFTAQNNTKAVLTYTGLSDGRNSYPDEVYQIEIEVESDTGDLLVTPLASSPRGGVYGANFTVSACAPGVSIEAPIWDGVRLSPDKMPVSLWHNFSGYWDYGFIALNGQRKGAVGVWLQDRDLRHYRSLFTLNNEEGLSFSLLCYNIPPFDACKETRMLPWRMQAFDKSWSQAAARYRDWRVKNVRLAKRPAWANHVSFVLSGPPGAQENWADMVNGYFENTGMERVVVWAATVRKAGFDDAHWDNTPYDKFKAEMQVWKQKTQARLMPYLQPMIVWAKTKAPPEAKWIMDMHWQANSLAAEHVTFQRFLTGLQQHNLAHAGWTDWFIKTWVNSYIQEYGADGIYHDQTTYCPMDNRAPDETFGGMTAVQGMANYFYRAQAENPDSIHASEHMMEYNSTGCSLGIGSDIHWGAGAMKTLRIRQASPVSAALHWPNGVIFSFPHMSGFYMQTDVIKAHQGMNLMERRAQIAGSAMINASLATGKVAPFDVWVNDMAITRQRDVAFVHHGLRPVFPEDWETGVLSYFKGVADEDFRYEETPWGSAFVEVKDGKKALQYGRIFGKGLKSAALQEGAVHGWVCYSPQGPSGLHPDFGYCVSPKARVPDVRFEPAAGAFKSCFVEGGYVCDRYATLTLQPLPGAESATETVRLVSPQPAKAVFVNGKPVQGSTITFQAPAEIVALFGDVKGGLEAVKETAALRMVTVGVVSVDILDPAWVTQKLTTVTEKDGSVTVGQNWTPHYRTHAFERYVLYKAEEAGALALKCTAGQMKGLWVNGVPPAAEAPIPMREGEVILIRTLGAAGTRLSLTWQTKQTL